MQLSPQELTSINFSLGIVCSIGGLFFACLTRRIASIRYLFRSSICVVCMGVMVSGTAFLHIQQLALRPSLEHTWYNIACDLIGLLITWLFFRSSRDRRETVCLLYLLGAEGLTLAMYVLEVLPPPPPLLDIILAWTAVGVVTILPGWWCIHKFFDRVPLQHRKHSGIFAFSVQRALVFTLIAASWWILAFIVVYARFMFLLPALPVAFVWAGAGYLSVFFLFVAGFNFATTYMDRVSACDSIANRTESVRTPY